MALGNSFMGYYADGARGCFFHGNMGCCLLGAPGFNGICFEPTLFTNVTPKFWGPGQGKGWMVYESGVLLVVSLILPS